MTHNEIDGSVPRPVLIRAVGPGLADFGIENALGDPRLSLYGADADLIVESANWGVGERVDELAAEMTRAGAFPLASGSADDAVLVLLEPGSYTAVVNAPAGDEGVVLLEMYDRGPLLGASRVINFSTRAETALGENAVISGIVVAPPFAQSLLLRAVGPALEEFGIDDAEQDPRLILRAGDQIIARNDQWSSGAEKERLTNEAARSGAFPFEEDSSDAALAVTLLPGVYTLEVVPGDDEGGVGLLEVYRRRPTS